MMKLSYKTLRPYILATVVLSATIGLGLWTYEEFASPNPIIIPEAGGIKNEAPIASETPSENTSVSVPPLQPKRLQIPSIGVNASIVAMGLTPEKLIDAPKSAWEVGWYKDSALPGSGKGAAFIDGHVNDSLNSPGVFFRLDELTKGSTITIIRGDDTEITYLVERAERQPLDQVDMNTLLTPVDPAHEGLTLVTCGGSYDKKRATFTERIIVYASASSG